MKCHKSKLQVLKAPPEPNIEFLDSLTERPMDPLPKQQIRVLSMKCKKYLSKETVYGT